jgi:hypothetical protein
MKQFERVVMFIGLLTGAAVGYAQEAPITEHVRDTSQASMAGAKSTLTSVETGDHSGAASGEEGNYAFALLLPGHYEFEAEKDGFETQRQTSAVAETGGPSNSNVTVKAETSTQMVNVDPSLLLLQTEVSEVYAVSQSDEDPSQ